MKKIVFKMLTMLLCLAMLVSMSGVVLCAQAAFIEGKPYNQYTYKEYTDLTSEEKIIFFKGFPSLSAFNSWYNAAKKAADEEKFVIGDSSIDLGQLLKTEASIADKKYSKLSDALNEAVSGDIIVLLADVEMTSVVVPAGATLDLNGKTLAVTEFGAAGKIVDSAAGDGLLKVAKDNATFLNTASLGNSALPVYDGADGGYRFYTYSFGNGVAQPTDTVGVVKFWYQFEFDSDAAYELLKTGNANVTMGVDVNYTGAAQPFSFYFVDGDSADAWMQTYADFVLGSNGGTPSENPWIWIQVANADAVSGMTLTPYITAGGLDIYMEPISLNAQ